MYPFTLVTVDKVCTTHAARFIVAAADFCCLLLRQKEFNAFFSVLAHFCVQHPGGFAALDLSVRTVLCVTENWLCSSLGLQIVLFELMCCQIVCLPRNVMCRYIEMNAFASKLQAKTASKLY